MKVLLVLAVLICGFEAFLLLVGGAHGPAFPWHVSVGYALVAALTLTFSYRKLAATTRSDRAVIFFYIVALLILLPFGLTLLEY